MADITETADIITALAELVSAVIEAGEDGYQITDLGIVVTDSRLRNALQAAIEGSSEVPVEVQDLTLREILDLIDHATGAVRDQLPAQS